MASVLCIYHAGCADGLGAAWAVHRALGEDVEFVAAKYGDAHELLTPAECAASGNCPSQEDVPRSCHICDGGLGWCKKCCRGEVELDQPCGIPRVEGLTMLIVDFSYSLTTLQAMAREARSVLVLDHHKTAQDDLKDIMTPPATWSSWIAPITWTGPNLRAIFDMNRSGAGITWDYLIGGTRSPIIKLIEDRDLWRFSLPDSRAFHALLTSYDIGDLPVMFKLLDKLNRWAESYKRHGYGSGHLDTECWQDAMREGYAILRAQEHAVAVAVASTRRTMRISGYVVPVANVPHEMASDAGHLLCIHPNQEQMGQAHLCDFSATYYDGADGRRHFSLRSPPGGADVGTIAKQMAAHFNWLTSENFKDFKYEWKGTWAGGGHEHAAGFDAPLGWEGE